MVFHLGILEYLAEQRWLERVTRISTVSGGSLLVGLILHECNMRWPTSEEFETKVLPSLRTKLCSKNMMLGAVRRLLNPLNWRFILARSNLLALTLREEWGITHR